MFSRFMSLFSTKPAPSRNIDVSKLFPIPSEADATTAQPETSPRKRSKRSSSYIQANEPSPYIRFR